MSDKSHNAYTGLLIRERWRLIEAIWLLHGIFMQTKNEFGIVMERFFDRASTKICGDSTEVGRLTEEYIRQMLQWNVSEVTVSTRISNWEELSNDWQESVEIRQSIENFWQLLNSTADIKKCEVCYIDERGKWYAFAPESMWDREYLLEFAEGQGIDIEWLTSEIKNHQKVPKRKALAMGSL